MRYELSKSLTNLAASSVVVVVKRCSVKWALIEKTQSGKKNTVWKEKAEHMGTRGDEVRSGSRSSLSEGLQRTMCV